MSKKAYRLHAVIAWLMIICAGSAQGEWITGLELGGGYDSNLTNAEHRADIDESTVGSGAITATYFQAFPDGLTISYSFTARGESVSSVSGLDNLNLGGSILFRKKLGLGTQAPWIGLSAGTTLLDYRNNSRDGWRHQVAILAGKRLAPRWNLYGSIIAEAREADALPPDEAFESGDVFSQDSLRGTLNLEYTLTNKWLLNVGAIYRNGDITTTATENYYFLYSADAAADDPVFNVNDEIYAYRLKGDTIGFNGSMIFSATIRDTLGLRVSFFDTDVDGGNYTGESYRLYWSHSF